LGRRLPNKEISYQDRNVDCGIRFTGFDRRLSCNTPGQAVCNRIFALERRQPVENALWLSLMEQFDYERLKCMHIGLKVALTHNM
jgi:hypothetical protein